MEEIPVRDLPGSVRSVSVSAAAHIDKAEKLRDQPTAIVEHRDAEELERALPAKGVRLTFIDGMAEETPASIPPVTPTRPET